MLIKEKEMMKPKISKQQHEQFKDESRFLFRIQFFNTCHIKEYIHCFLHIISFIVILIFHSTTSCTLELEYGRKNKGCSSSSERGVRNET